jgi:hypothetical protein
MSVTERQIDAPSPYEVALESAIKDGARAHELVRERRAALAAAEGRAHELVKLAETLLKQIPPDRQPKYRQRVAVLRAPTRSGRATTTYENVIDLFTKQPRHEWTASQIQRSLAAKGIAAPPEQIQNVLQYLLRKGRLKRVERGRYYVVGYGLGIETADDILEGEQMN